MHEAVGMVLRDLGHRLEARYHDNGIYEFVLHGKNICECVGACDI